MMSRAERLRLHAAAYERSIASIRAVMDSERAALEAAGIPEDDVAEAMACIEAGIEDGLETLRHYALMSWFRSIYDNIVNLDS